MISEPTWHGEPVPLSTEGRVDAPGTSSTGSSPTRAPGHTTSSQPGFLLSIMATFWQVPARVSMVLPGDVRSSSSGARGRHPGFRTIPVAWVWSRLPLHGFGRNHRLSSSAGSGNICILYNYPCSGRSRTQGEGITTYHGDAVHIEKRIDARTMSVQRQNGQNENARAECCPNGEQRLHPFPVPCDRSGRFCCHGTI